MSLLKEKFKYNLILYFLSPILGLFYGLKSGNYKYIRWSIFVFTIFYGSLLTFNLLGGALGSDAGSDGARHWNSVYEHYQYLDIGVWWNELKSILAFSPKSTTKDDPFIHFLSFFVGGILRMPGLFWVVLSIVYGYFSSGVIVKILQRINWKTGHNKFYFAFFLFIFLLSFSPLNMQTVRTWTGMWVLVYAVLSYEETKKKKYLFLALAPVTIHVGYFALGIGIWFVLFTGIRNLRFLFFGFVASIFLSTAIDFLGLDQVIAQTPLGSSKLDAYYVDDKKAENFETRLQESETNFYKRYEEYKIQKYVFSAMLLFLYFVFSKRSLSHFQKTLLSYALAMAIVSNLFTLLYAVHNRGWIIASFFIFSLMLIILSNRTLPKRKLGFLIYQLPLFLITVTIIPYMLFVLSRFINFTSGYILITPFFSWFDGDLSFSLKDILVVFF